MKVSYNWLSQYVDIKDVSPYELAEKLTRSGVAVDIVEKRNIGLENVVIGYVVEREQHPDAEKLSLCKVNVGQEVPLQIICGAANVAAGQKVPVALVGAKLPGDVKIKKAKLRGVLSEGMICSAKELGMNEKLLPKNKTEGILVLPEDAQVGLDIQSLLGFDDYILELDLTPNRSDCLSMIGVAYEVAAILNKEVKLPQDNLGVKISTESKIKVKIEAPEACTHYAARLLKNIKIAESPQWIQNRLIAAGIRPINNVVDVTNYILMEYGQPLHAFDFERLTKPEILVRMAQPGEKMITLDDQERELDEQMLLITDGTEPIAIAGVMGSADSEVINETTQVLLESACFNGSSIRRTSKKLGLRSEASLRFEKGVDPNRIYSALNRAAELLQEMAGATLEGEIFEHIVEQPKERTIILNTKRVNGLLGTEIKLDEIKSIFKRLSFTTQDIKEGLLVSVPTRRQDISIEADLIEEIARIHGYDNIPTTLPSGIYIQGGLTIKQKLRRKIKNLLESVGMQEIISYTLSNDKTQDIFSGLSDRKKPINIAMPMSEERKRLRTSLLPNLLEIAKYNINHRNANIRIYEIGATFIASEEKLSELPSEIWIIAGLITGSLPKHWQKSSDKLDFYYVKGVLEELLTELGLQKAQFNRVSLIGYHPGRTAEITFADNSLGYIGQLHPEVQTSFDLEETYIFELNLNTILTLANTEIDYKQMPKYPAIERDIALVVPKNLESKLLLDTIRNSSGDLLEDATLFDVYEGEQIGSDKKSIAVSLVYRSNNKTLTDEEVAKVHEQVLEAVKEKYEVDLRK